MTDQPDVRTTHRGRLLTVDVLSWTDADGRAVQREVVHHPGAVLVVPRLDDERLVLVRNERVAVQRHLLEFPAGKLEPGEDPQDAAGRELEEETGYRPGRVRALGEFYTSPGFCDELMRVFVADELEQVGQKLEPGENLEVVLITRSEVMSMIGDRRIRDGKTIAALLMWILAPREAVT
jgi:ADP-ribose pyrophosphatase